MLVFVVACGSPELHHYRQDSCTQEYQSIQQPTYSLHLLVNCGAGAAIRESEWIEQRMKILPGLYMVRTIASFYGATRSEMSMIGPDKLRYRRHEGETPEGIWDYEYTVKSHLYF